MEQKTGAQFKVWTMLSSKGRDLYSLAMEKSRAWKLGQKDKNHNNGCLLAIAVKDRKWRVVLDEPGSRVGVELCGRWPAGARFRPAGPKDVTPPAPNTSLVLLLLKGSGTVDVGGVTFGLRAPPGPALLEWDSVAGTRPQPLKLDKLPSWADPTAMTRPV